MVSLFKRYGLYLLRWQLSTPILAVCLWYFSTLGNLWSTIMANLIGGLMFFWVDRFIFTHHCLGSTWEVKEEIACADCGMTARGYRLVCSGSGKYDKRLDPRPEFRCEHCSQKKMSGMKLEGKV